MMSEGNELDDEVSSRHNADCIRTAEDTAAMRKMTKHKAAGLSGLVAEMTQATGDTGIQWLTDLCNGIVKEG